MRAIVWGFLSVWAAACQPAEAAPRSDGTLELELGGEHEPLGEVLRGREGDAPLSEPEPDVPPPAERGEGEDDGGTRQEPPEPRPAEPPRERPEPRRRTVVLGEGRTLYSLAAEHLGDGSRWRELLPLNGWTEADVGNLPTGTRVILPPR